MPPISAGGAVKPSDSPDRVRPGRMRREMRCFRDAGLSTRPTATVPMRGAAPAASTMLLIAYALQRMAQVGVIKESGPLAKRPRLDTLKGSKNANMKELRFSAAGGEWRAAFAFDPKRRAILLVAGDKSGLGPSKAQRKFYDDLIARADVRFDAHLNRMRK